MMQFLIGDKVIITSQRSGNNLEKKLTHINPAKNDELVKGKKKLGRNYWSNGNSLIEAEKLALFMVDECHLLWGYLLSYAWGRKDK